MPISNKFFHDKIVLLMLSVNTLLAGVASLWVLLRLDSSELDGYIVQYRSNLGISAFKTGDTIDILGFIVFVALVAAFHWYLAARVYAFRRDAALAILGLGTFLLVSALVVSDALLRL